LWTFIIVLAWSAASLGVVWTVPRILLLLEAIAGGACLFVGLFVLQATMCFWSTESLEIMNTVTYGGVETAQYPITIYRDGFRKFFTYMVPLAAFSSYPALAILGRQDPLGSTQLFQVLAPLIGVAFLMVTLQVWRIGERHYRSTGS
jgi:ABC-2 type transport system permease protein